MTRGAGGIGVQLKRERELREMQSLAIPGRVAVLLLLRKGCQERCNKGVAVLLWLMKGYQRHLDELLLKSEDRCRDNCCFTSSFCEDKSVSNKHPMNE